MQFWNSSDPIFLDRDAAIEDYRGLAERAAGRDPRIERVILFGSLALDRATPMSDADLLIVLRDHTGRPMDRVLELIPHFSGGPLPVDLFPVTSTELAARLGRGESFLEQAVSGGIELWRRSD